MKIMADMLVDIEDLDLDKAQRARDVGASSSRGEVNVKVPRQPKWRRQAKGLDVNTQVKGTE